jgi:Flp pilus assembly protein TadG
MQQKLWVALALVGAAFSAGCGGDDAGAPAADEATAEQTTTAAGHEAGEPVKVTLEEVDGSGVSGEATLSAAAEGSSTFTVEVEVGPAGANSRPAHIHDVTCAEYAQIEDSDEQAATVTDTLENVDEEGSTSTVRVELTERTTGEYSINVHSAFIPFPAVACGDIPAHE